MKFKILQRQPRLPPRRGRHRRARLRELAAVLVLVEDLLDLRDAAHLAIEPFG